MQEYEIWHNEKCSKSRAALELLETTNSNIKVIKYLETIPTKDELKKVLKMLSLSANQIMRTKEEIYISLNLKNELQEDKLISAMIKYPILIERPIIIKNGKAVIARPIENINTL